MFIVVSGGAASGKSEIAENIASQCTGRKIYIATMEVWDDEGQKRVERHREMRRDKGFETLECPRNLINIQIPEESTVLLECLSNLTANEYFGQEGFEDAPERIMLGIDRLYERVSNIIVVTNELFGDGVEYEAETMRYLKILSDINYSLAEKADSVIEVVCGIPVYWKGEPYSEAT